MRGRTVKLMIVAVVFGGVAAALTAWFRPQPSAVAVLVARQPLERWTPVRDPAALFGLAEMPGNLPLPPNAVRSFEQLQGRGQDYLLSRPLKQGEVLSLDHLVERSQGGLSAMLRPGFSGLTVRLTSENAPGPLLRPNDHVKVIGVRRLRDGGRESVVLMKNIRVVAVDTRLEPADKAAAAPQTVTLEVTDDEAARLKLAQEEGPIALAVMALADRADPSDRGGPERTPPPAPTVPVLVARAVLPRGTSLADCQSLVEQRELPRASLDRQRLYFSSLEQLKEQAGRVLERTVAAGEPLCLDAVVAPNTPPPHTLTLIEPTRGTRVFVWEESQHRFRPLTGNPEP